MLAGGGPLGLCHGFGLPGGCRARQQAEEALEALREDIDAMQQQRTRLQSERAQAEALRYSVDYLMSLRVAGTRPGEVGPEDAIGHETGDWELTASWLRGEAKTVLRVAKLRGVGRPAKGTPEWEPLSPEASEWAGDLARRLDLRVLVTGPDWRDVRLCGSIPAWWDQQGNQQHGGTATKDGTTQSNSVSPSRDGWHSHSESSIRSIRARSRIRTATG
jgi:hypothetical protein